MSEIHAWERPPAPWDRGASLLEKIRSGFETPLGLAAFATLAIAPALSLALHPQWRWLALAKLLPAILIAPLLGVFILGDVVASFREIADLVKDHRTRVIHGLEHATAVLLARRGFQIRGGQTERGYFKLWLRTEQREGKRKVRGGATAIVRGACAKAIRRMRAGEASLAIHPKCGTNWASLMILASLAALAAVPLALFARIEATTLLQLSGAFLVVLTLGSRVFGSLLQRTLTVATDFQRAAVQRIIRRVEEDGSVCYYVHLDVELNGR